MFQTKQSTKTVLTNNKRIPQWNCDWEQIIAKVLIFQNIMSFQLDYFDQKDAFTR